MKFNPQVAELFNLLFFVHIQNILTAKYFYYHSQWKCHVYA